MDGMLSQDEINALLSGMDLSGDETPDMGGAGTTDTADPGGSADSAGDRQCGGYHNCDPLLCQVTRCQGCIFIHHHHGAGGTFQEKSGFPS